VRLLLGILLVFMLAGRAHAQNARTPSVFQERKELPDAPKPKINRRIFIVGVSLLAASTAADLKSTRSIIDRGGWENNPLFGRHPSSGTLASRGALIFAGRSTAFYFTERNRHAWVRWAGRAYIGFAIEEHARLAACNSRIINTHSPNVQNCRPLLPF